MLRKSRFQSWKKSWKNLKLIENLERKQLEKNQEYKPQYKSGLSELSFQKKATNSLKSLLNQKKDELNQTLLSFIDTLLKDIKRYKTLSDNTLRKLVLSKKNDEKAYDELIESIEILRRKIGGDYLEIILNKHCQILNMYTYSFG